CDDLLLDKVWAKVVPLAAFADAQLPPLLSVKNASTWSSLISSLPHPPLSSLPPLADAAIISVAVLTIIGIHLLYFIFATLSYYYIFDHAMMKHPRFLKNQVRLEIESSLNAFPWITVLTMPWFIGEVRGHAKLYADVNEYGWTYLALSVPLTLFFLFLLKFPTPFASHAFHPVDGYLQGVPYHLFAFLFPIHRYAYVCLFVFVNFWTIFIHDSDMLTGHPLKDIINGPAHHTLHHLYYTCNYGQYFTWADRVGKSYRAPRPELDPMLEVKAAEKAKGKRE
ncbi:hypothetical protein BOTBODRAFT_179645, partial [Botryobasidium botryosum FD-172 SS1]